jgi:hypothetical protein
MAGLIPENPATPAYEPLGPLLAAVLDCAARSLSLGVARALVMPGNSVVHDDCCEGQLWTRVVSVVGASALAVPAMQPCLPLYQVRFGVGVLRCAHTVDDDGNAPTPAEMTADAFQSFQDRADLVRALTCCVPDLEAVKPYKKSMKIEDWLPGTIQGGCLDSEITFTLNMPLCPGCDEDYDQTSPDMDPTPGVPA